MLKEKHTRIWFLILFGLPFFAVALFFLFRISVGFYDHLRMASWYQTQGMLLSAQLHSHTSDNNTSYSATAEYRYSVNGLDYSGERVAIVGGSDNIGDFQEQLGNRLELLYRNHQPVTVFYDPADPGDAILNRDIRWSMVGFQSVFIVAFGAFGIAMIYFGLRGKRSINSPESVEKPWLARPEWVDNRIRSGARTGVYAVWFFAVIWNALSTPAAIALPDIWRKEGMLALAVLLFPIVGLGLIYWAIKKTLEWRRFGATPLVLDPFPGAIGGDVGGEVLLNLPYQRGLACEVTLSSLYSYESGSGKDRSRHERVEWQDSGYAQAEPVIQRRGRGTRLRFRFAVPEGLQPSEEEQGDYYLWRLAIKAELSGSDLDRAFTIPVYPTGETSSYQHLDSGSEVPLGVAEPKAEKLLPLRRNGMQQELYFPMLRQLSGLGLALVGGIFAGIGLVLWGKALKEGAALYMMGGIFSALGGLVLVAGLYTALNSLFVTWDGRRVITVRRVLGMIVRRRSAAYHEIQNIGVKKGANSTQRGEIHQIDYHIVANTSKGQMVLAEQLDSHSKAKLVAEFFRKQFGVSD